MGKYPVKGKYFGWNIDDVPASELLRLKKDQIKIPYWLHNYIYIRRSDLEKEIKMKDSFPDLIKESIKKFNEATFVRDMKTERKLFHKEKLNYLSTFEKYGKL